MLDNATKKRIDDCRDILVGKLPDPKSQIEQITIALIYKFMDDMDKEAVELGGDAKFFSGDFEKYSWDNLFAAKVTANEMLKLYSEAIESMEKNPNIPQLFRDIFKNAYLPYRDPETLKLFLKTIGEFEYTHSEKLGDAFEYLLSVMGSQGDAGQFRTPRHIIDFLVKAVDPDKTDTILDPACGTAGFLISAFKHIKEKNNNQLNPGERKRLIKNIIGYDISPDMVRLSLVNLYLHGFSNPHIFEYDTLTSEERWNETFDVILANPPFMSPKGGIRPHKRFTVSSSRSEVLFVDYIAEHLNPNGRAGVIVPEGIIFQSGKAYKELRKMLVENYLYAVVSLPAGVFNPYSGVKTSILLMDKALARKTDKILFVKIENDGYSLSAQRTPVKGGQLSTAVEIIKNYKLKIKNDEKFEDSELAHAIEKSKIAENGDFNLSGARYKEQLVINSDWPLVELGEVIELEYGKPLKKSERKGGRYPVFGSNGIVGWHDKYLVEGPFIIVGRKGSAGAITYSTKNGYPIDTTFYVKIKDNDKLLLGFIYNILKELNLDKINVQAGIPGLNRNDAYKIKIPLPPLSVQEEIVAEIEGYQKIIDGAKMVVENYKPKIDIDPDWEIKTIKELSIIMTKGSSPKWQGVKYTIKENGILFITSENIGNGELLLEKKKYVEKKFNEIEKKSILKKGDILTNIVGASIGRTAIFDIDEIANINQAVCIIRPNNKIVEPLFLMHFFNTDFFIALLLGNKVENARANVSMSVLGNLRIPLPPLETQKQIVARIEKEQELVNANKELIAIFEQKIKDRIARVWGVSTGSAAKG